MRFQTRLPIRETGGEHVLFTRVDIFEGARNSKGAKAIDQEKMRDPSSSQVIKVLTLEQPTDAISFLKCVTDRQKLSLQSGRSYPFSPGGSFCLFVGL